MNAVQFVTRAAQVGAGTVGLRDPLPGLDSAELWPAVLQLAIEHRVATLVWEAISRSPELTPPAETRDAFAAQLIRSSATRLLCESTLASLLSILHDAGVEIIVLKGPTVAHSLYARPELRIYHDLDILCRVSDYSALHNALTSNGYTSAGTLDARGSHEHLAQKPSPFESHAVRGFYDPSGEVKVEVHFDALQLGLFDRNEARFWRESRTRELNGLTMRVLAPEHQFLHLAVHAHRHGYTRLSWLIELDLFIRQAYDSLDWARLNEVARAEGIGTALRHALATAHAILGAPLPRLPPPTLEERCLGVCYRALWPFAQVGRLNQHERHRLLHFLPDDADARNFLYGLLLMGRRREKLHALLLRRFRSARR